MIYEGLGFPIHIENAPIKTLLGEPVLDLNLEWLQRTAFGLLLDSSFRLTGSQVRFVRHHLELTQAKSAEMLGLANHSVVSQWEKRADAAAGMDKSVETLLRLHMAKSRGDDASIKRWLERKLSEGLARVELKAS